MTENVWIAIFSVATPIAIATGVALTKVWAGHQRHTERLESVEKTLTQHAEALEASKKDRQDLHLLAERVGEAILWIKDTLKEIKRDLEEAQRR